VWWGGGVVGERAAREGGSRGGVGRWGAGGAEVVFGMGRASAWRREGGWTGGVLRCLGGLDWCIGVVVWCNRTSNVGAGAGGAQPRHASLRCHTRCSSSSLAPEGVYRAACANLVRPRGPWARDAVWHAAAPSSGARLRSAQGGAFNAVWPAACGPVFLFGVGVCAPWTSPPTWLKSVAPRKDFISCRRWLPVFNANHLGSLRACGFR